MHKAKRILFLNLKLLKKNVMKRNIGYNCFLKQAV